MEDFRGLEENKNYNRKNEIDKGMRELPFKPCNGFVILSLYIFLMVGGLFLTIGITVMHTNILAFSIPFGLIMFFSSFFFPFSFKVNHVNEAKVLLCFGTYKGTVKQSGFIWISPFYNDITMSLKSNNLNGALIKVNDKTGNPILISCNCVWKIKNTAKARFDVENYTDYVWVQSESAVRHIGCKYRYEKVHSEDICLQSGSDIISKELKNELERRFAKAGIEVEEARISGLAYSPEISNAMLKRQAALSLINARKKIVQGAIGIVSQALYNLRANNVCEMTKEKKSALVSNMLLVLCSDSQVSPIVDTGFGDKNDLFN